MKKQYIGVTGLTTPEDVENVKKALDGHYGMYGVLMSKKRLGMKKSERRWIGIDNLVDVMEKMPDDALRTVHWCAPKFDIYDVCKAIDIIGDGCNAVQLNMVYPPPERLEAIKRNYPNLQIIFQIERCMFEEPKVMSKKMEPYESLIDYVIIDQSMGEGIPINPAVSRVVAEEFEKLNIGIVFAGGLTAKRVKDIGDLIREFDASIDAEGQLMNPETDTLDSLKVKNYIEAAIDEMHNKK